MHYTELFTFENLYQAHLKARKNKMHKSDVLDFDFNSSIYLWDLFEQLNSKTYHVSGYNKFYIYEPKEREIQALSYYDRIVQHCLCDNYLYPLLTNRFVFDNGACQKGKGTSFAYKRLTHFLSDYYKHYGSKGYIFKADIRHFFPSVDHEERRDLSLSNCSDLRRRYGYALRISLAFPCILQVCHTALNVHTGSEISIIFEISSGIFN